MGSFQICKHLDYFSLNTENLPSFNCGVWTRLGEGGYAYFPGGRCYY